jgi:hypothetical protein
VAALVLGIVSLIASCWLGVILGVPAIALGVLAHRDIGRAQGLSTGRGLATAGIVLGSVATAVCIGWFGMIGFVALSAQRAAPTATAPTPLGPPTAATTTAPKVPPGGWGAIHVVEIHPSAATSLRAQLADEVKAAKLAGETVLVETIAASCTACDEIARAMRDPPLQSTLEKARVVRVDIDEFGLEGDALRLNEPELPWFYLVDSHGNPRDAISADEWDDNTAEDIAPVLDAFVHGRLPSRHRSWRGGTPL